MNYFDFLKNKNCFFFLLFATFRQVLLTEAVVSGIICKFCMEMKELSTKWVMALLFWDVSSTTYIDFLENCKTNNEECYVNLLEISNYTIKEKLPVWR